MEVETLFMIHLEEYLFLIKQKNVYVIMVKMLYYNRFNVSEGIDVNKTSASKECIICQKNLR